MHTCCNKYLGINVEYIDGPIMKNAPVLIKDSLNYKIYRLAMLLRRHLIRTLRAYGLTPERWQVLCALWEHPEGVCQCGLGVVTLKDEPSISRLISAMIKEGWVTRKISKTDSRAYNVQPSEKALQMKEEIIDRLHSGSQKLMKGLSSSKQQALNELVSEYIDILEACDT